MKNALIEKLNAARHELNNIEKLLLCSSISGNFRATSTAYRESLKRYIAEIEKQIENENKKAEN